MRRQGLDCFLIEKPLDIFYYTGVKLSRGTLLIDQRKSYLLVDGRYLEAAKKIAPCPVMKEKKGNLLSLLTLEKNPKEKRLAFDPATCSYLDYKEMKQLIAEGKKKGSTLVLVEREGLLQKVRGIKDEKEIVCLKESAQLLYKGYEFLLTKVKVGVREADLAREFEFFCRKKGAEALSFEPIIAF
ncbi:MAG: aminopeptidase P family N-terminal domain-containing protein, partial [Simkania negevensis]|nr:aminopeptidase P family N-terminal domain-containing protein [Simkania negevensis]